MKKVIAIAAILLVASTALAQEVNWFKGSFDEAMQRAKLENKTILINFFSGSG